VLFHPQYARNDGIARLEIPKFDGYSRRVIVLGGGDMCGVIVDVSVYDREGHFFSRHSACETLTHCD
jgi:hypothetical protein